VSRIAKPATSATQPVVCSSQLPNGIPGLPSRRPSSSPASSVPMKASGGGNFTRALSASMSIRPSVPSRAMARIGAGRNRGLVIFQCLRKCMP